MANIIPALTSAINYISTGVRRAFGGVNKFTRNFLFLGGNALTYPDVNAWKAIVDGYEGNGAVYAVVKKDAKKFASIPRFIYKLGVDTDDSERITSGSAIGDNIKQLISLLNRPNEYQGQDAFLESVKAFYDVTGEAFIWLNRGDTQMLDNNGQLIDRTDDQIDRLPVLEMYVIPSNIVYLVPDPNNAFGVIGYVFEIGGRRLNIRKNDVIHWKSASMCFDAYNRRHLRGLSPLHPGRRILQQNNDAVDSSVRMFQNDGARGVLFNETFDKLNPKQQSDVRDVVDARINNNEIKGSVATLQGKWGYVNFGGTAVDMELIKAVDMSLKQVCMIFDVPAELFDVNVTYENKEKALKGWVYNSIIPASKQFDDELNRILLMAFQLDRGAYAIQCDHTELPELQQDMKDLVTNLNLAWWITPNEKRQAMGEEPYDDEIFNEPWIPAGFTPLSQLEGDGFNQMQNDLAAQGLDNYNQNDSNA